MNTETQDKLEQAVMNYVDGLPLDSLIEWVSNDLYQYYCKNPDSSELQEFLNAYCTDDS